MPVHTTSSSAVADATDSHEFLLAAAGVCAA